jgi:hypothetical protein
MRATGRHMDENCRPVLVSDMVTLPPSHVCLSGSAHLTDRRCKGMTWGLAEGTSAGSQILCSLPRMKQPPGGRAERLLMSMS